MPSSKGPYPVEYRQRIVELVHAGRSVASISKEFGVSEPTIRTWVAQFARDAGKRGDGLTTGEMAELARLRREVRTLREEREILKNFAAWSVQEANRTPPKRYGS